MTTSYGSLAVDAASTAGLQILARDSCPSRVARPWSRISICSRFAHHLLQAHGRVGGRTGLWKTAGDPAGRAPVGQVSCGASTEHAPLMCSRSLATIHAEFPSIALEDQGFLGSCSMRERFIAALPDEELRRLVRELWGTRDLGRSDLSAEEYWRLFEKLVERLAVRELGQSTVRPNSAGGQPQRAGPLFGTEARLPVPSPGHQRVHAAQPSAKVALLRPSRHW